MVNVPRTSNTKSSRASDINTPSASNANSSRTSDANYPVNNTSQPQPLTINDVSTIVLYPLLKPYRVTTHTLLQLGTMKGHPPVILVSNLY